MSETYEPQAFLGFSINAVPPKAPMCESHVVEKPKAQTLQRTISRKARRVRAKERQRAEIFKSLPVDASAEDIDWALFPKAMKQRKDADARKTLRANKHACYAATIHSMNRNPSAFKRFFKMSQEAYAIFEKHYEGQEESQWTVSSQLSAELETLRQSPPTPTIDFQHFPAANIPAIEQRIAQVHNWSDPCPPQLGMPDYVPQSGSLETCANLLDSYDKVVASPLYGQVISLLKWENPVFSTAALLATSLSLFVLKTCVMTFNFLLGCLIGVIFINKPPRYRYAPQAATLASDDGALFTGTKTKSKTNVSPTSDKPASQGTPGMTTSAINVRYNQILPRVAPNKKISKKDPNDGYLNGFGIGI